MSTILSPTLDLDPISDPISRRSSESHESRSISVFEKLDPNRKQAPSKFWAAGRSGYVILFGILAPAFVSILFVCNSFASLYQRQPFGALNELLLLLLLPACTAIAWFLVGHNRISKAHAIGLTLGIQTSLALSFWSTWLVQPPLSIFWPESDAFRLIILLAPFSFGASFLLMVRTIAHESEAFAVKSTRFGILGAILGAVIAFGPHLRTYFFDTYTRVIANESRIETLDFLRKNATQEELENIFRLPPYSTRFGLGCVHLFGQPCPGGDASLYFRLTGKTLIPHLPSVSDQNLGMQVIGSKVAGLALASSSIDGNFDSHSATGSLNWTMNFVNKSKVAQEARATLTLPPGAVISRVTLWINGQPHEAAFGSVEQTKGAYQWIVQRHRDPLLVTWAGDQKVFVQAYPVPAFGGHLQLRLGLKTPLAIQDLHHCTLRVPSLLSSNFNDAENVQINLHGDGGNSIASTVRSSSLADQTFAIYRPSSELQVASKDYYAPNRQFILEKFVPKKLEPSGKTVFVIDASALMRDHVKEIVESICSLKGSNLKARNGSTVIIAREDQAQQDPTMLETMPEEMLLEEGLNKILASDFKGGYTNESAVLQALQSAGTAVNGTVVWIHGPQPIASTFQNLEMLGLYHHPKLIDFPIDEGRNELKPLWESSGVKNVIAYEPWQRRGSISTNLKQVLHRLYDQSQVTYQPVQEMVPSLNGLTIDKRPELAAELSALWANSIVENLHKEGQETVAQDIGTRYRIISKCTAGTVLERDSDYQAFQLKTGNYVDAVEKQGMATSVVPLSGATFGTISAAGATNGTIGPQSGDATYIAGVNTSGAVRVNNLANFEAIVNCASTALFCAALIFSVVALTLSCMPRFANKARRLFAGGIIALLFGSCLSTVLQAVIVYMQDNNMF